MNTFHSDFAKWTGAISKRISNAIGSSCDELVRETRKALSKTGPNAALQREFGIDKQTGPHNRDKGISALSNLQERRIGSVTIHWGGTFDDGNKKHDRIYWYGEPLNKWAQASPVGQPPHKQTGTLRRNIDRQLQRSASGMVTSGRVGPLDNLVYARRHELGGPRKYPARPYLTPTFEKLRAKIEARLKAAVKGEGK